MAYPAPVYPYCGPVAHDSGTGNLPIRRIVIHCTAGSDGKGSTGTCAYFRQEEAGGSAHYITDANLTIQPARLNVVCWHAPPNSHSVGIEMCCSLSNLGKGHWTLDSHVKMMERTAKLTAELCLYLDIPVVRLTVAQVKAGNMGICGHVDVSKAFGQSSHWDPGPYFPWDTFMAMVRAWVKKLTTPVVPGPDPDEEDAMAALTQDQVAKAVETGFGDYWARYMNPAINGTGGKNRLEDEAWQAAMLAETRAQTGALERIATALESATTPQAGS